VIPSTAKGPNDDDLAHIRGLPLFAAVEPSSLAQAMGHCRVLELEADAVLLQPGQHNATIFVLLEGKASVRLPGETGEAAGGAPIPIGVGESVGELSAIDREPVSAEVRSDAACRFLCIGREVFWQELAPLPGVAEALLRGLSTRLRNTNRMALEAQRRSLELAHLQKELAAARKLQESLLPLAPPLLPEGHRLRAATRMRSASAASGDLFDLVPLDGDRLFLCIGDVTGHGMGAALFMARTIGLVRLLAHQIHAPGELMAALNDRLCDSRSNGPYVTMFCGVLDGTTGHFTYANAGHCPPLKLQPDQITPLPVPRGVLLGAFPGVPYQEMEAQLAPGEGLLLYTDGLTEAENRQGEPFGMERCLQVSGTAEPDALLDQLLDGWSRFAEADPPADDCALLAIQRKISG